MKVMIRQSSPDRPSIRKARSTLRSPAGDPGPDDVGAGRRASAASGSAAEEGVDGDEAGARRWRRPRRATTVSRFQLAPEQHQDRRAQERQQRDEAEVEGHRRQSSSALHQRGFVEVDGLAAAEEADEDGQAHRRLGGGQGDDEEREDVPLLVAERARERQQRQVAGVELQLDRP